MKKTKTLYWIITSLFAAFMAFTSIPDIMMVPDALAFMKSLGYPDYLTPFLGVAKVLGCIAILVPGFPRIKEWAYAGLAFDLIAATYSVVAIYGLHASIIFMILPIVFLFLSYGLYQARIKNQETGIRNSASL